jgi:hypothetical protein
LLVARLGNEMVNNQHAIADFLLVHLRDRLFGILCFFEVDVAVIELLVLCILLNLSGQNLAKRLKHVEELRVGSSLGQVLDE